MELDVFLFGNLDHSVQLIFIGHHLIGREIAFDNLDKEFILHAFGAAYFHHFYIDFDAFPRLYDTLVRDHHVAMRLVGFDLKLGSLTLKPTLLSVVLLSSRLENFFVSDSWKTSFVGGEISAK